MDLPPPPPPSAYAGDDGFGEVGLAVGGAGKYVPPSRRAGGGPDVGGPGGPPGAPAAVVDERDLNSLRISNLSEDADEDELRAIFRPYGHIERFYVARDRETNVGRGFAFVTFSRHDEAERARLGLNGFPYEHLILRVRAKAGAGWCGVVWWGGVVDGWQVGGLPGSHHLHAWSQPCSAHCSSPLPPSFPYPILPLAFRWTGPSRPSRRARVAVAWAVAAACSSCRATARRCHRG
jgi:hypothetical protein